MHEDDILVELSNLIKFIMLLMIFVSAPSKENPCCVIDSQDSTNRPIEFQVYTALNKL